MSIRVFKVEVSFILAISAFLLFLAVTAFTVFSAISAFLAEEETGVGGHPAAEGHLEGWCPEEWCPVVWMSMVKSSLMSIFGISGIFAICGGGS